jgi:hypothetical protein
MIICPRLMGNEILLFLTAGMGSKLGILLKQNFKLNSLDILFQFDISFWIFFLFLTVSVTVGFRYDVSEIFSTLFRTLHLC